MAEFYQRAAEALKIGISQGLNIKTEPAQSRGDIGCIIRRIGEHRHILIVTVTDDEGDPAVGTGLRPPDQTCNDRGDEAPSPCDSNIHFLLAHESGLTLHVWLERYTFFAGTF